MGIVIVFPTQWYGVPSVRIGKRFVETIVVEIDRVWNRHWNAERVVFQMVILQKVCLVSGASNIRDWINSRLNLCNRGAYN